MIGQKEIYDILNNLNISFEYYEHPPIPVAEEALNYKRGENTTYCKNLFFRNHKGNRHYYVLLESTQKLAIKDLEKKLKQGKISFASGWRLEKYLGVKGGSVSIFGLIFDQEHHVYVYIDKNLQQAEKISFHPNDNRASLVITYEEFIRFIEYVGNGYEFIDIAQ